MVTLPPVGFMLWRIGEILDVDRQIEWVHMHGFDAISLHASAGIDGKWRGLAPEMMDGSQRRSLRRKLSHFRGREVHAPFSAVLKVGETEAALAILDPVLAFAGDIGANIVTVHAQVPSADSAEIAAWTDAAAELNAMAERCNVRIGLEITSRFETVRDLALPCVGVTLDVGHMFLGEPPPIAGFRDLDKVVETIGQALLHLHVHDVREGVDHIELGTGELDYVPLIWGLRTIGYSGMLCLELNPDRVTPEGIVRSGQWLRQRWMAGR